MNSQDSLEFCKSEINRMIKNAQTKIIFPIITFGLLRKFNLSKQNIFTDNEIRKIYIDAVFHFKEFLNHNLHIGGKYYDAHPVRNLPKYQVLRVLEHKRFELTESYKKNSKHLEEWIPSQVKTYINKKLGIIPSLSNNEFRFTIAENETKFIETISNHIDRNSSNFEIFSFAIIKIHLEKFACKIYRDSKTSAYDRGVDLSTDFGVVYQVKKLKLSNKQKADEIFSELRSNFDSERIKDGKIIIVIDDISRELKKYLINMKIQSIKKSEIIKLAEEVDEVEDRLKILRIIYEEFRREYESDI